MAIAPRPLRGSDVASALSEPGTKVPKSAIPFGTAPGTVADGSAIANAEALANAAVDTANAANTKATAASSAVQSAANKADAAAAKADGADSKATAASTTASAAASSATSALSKAGQAIATAGDAQVAADQVAASLDAVSSRASAAASTATRAMSIATDASTAASDASTRASSAETKAATASTAAGKAQTDATSALNSIGTITTKSDAAATKADAALSLANSTKTIADSALAIGNGADAKAAAAQATATDASGKATSAQTSLAAINTRLSATPTFAADSTGLKLTFGGKDYLIPTSGIAAPAAVPLASAGYRMPNTLFSIDPALPASTAPLTAGQPGIQLNSNGNGEVQAMNEAMSAIPITHGQYGQVALKPASGVRPYAYFDQSTNSSSWDSLILPASTGTGMFGPDGAPWWVSFVYTPTGTDVNGAQLMKVVSASGVNVFIEPLGDGRLAVQQNNGAATGSEPANPRAALGRRSLITILCNGSTIAIFREGVKTYETAPGTIGGFNGPPAVFEFANKPQGQLELIEGGTGNPSISTHSAYIADKGTRYGITTVAVTEGSLSTILPAAVDTTQQFFSVPNFPISDTPPIIAGRTLGGGLTLSSDTPVFNYVFGTNVAGANVTDGRRVRELFYLHHFPGDPMNGGILRAPTDTAHPAGQERFWGVMRYYPVGHPNDVHIIGPDGLTLLAYGRNNNTRWALREVYCGMIRLPTPILPGMTLRIRWKKGGGRYAWAPWWLASGDEFTPGAGVTDSGAYWAGFSTDFSNPTASRRREAQSNHFHELDLDDNFDRTPDGSPPGRSVDFIPVWDIYQTQYNTTPGSVWEKNTGAYAWVNGHTRTTFDQSAQFYDQVVSWRTDGTNRIDQFMGPPGGPYTLIHTIQMEYHPNTYITMDGATRTMGMNLVVSNQAVPDFAGGFPNVTNATEGAALTNSISPTIQAIDAWRGVVLNPDSLRS